MTPNIVALRKESVDRNHVRSFTSKDKNTSLSARRAWIEIETLYISLTTFYTSLSARRAWIEILIIKLIRAGGRVALRKESVDRNMYPK